MSNEQTNFKVTDRRLFNPDGTPRDVPPEERPEPKPATVAETSGVSSGQAEAQSTSKLRAQPETASDQTGQSTSAPAGATSATTSDQATSPVEATSSHPAETRVNEEEELLDAEDPAGFVNFMMSIASNAAASLGMMEHPVTHQRDVDLELAKHWIDILGMLQKKTRGNLLPQEEKILEGLLADLRMQFVSHTSSAKPKASRAYTGRDIVGG